MFFENCYNGTLYDSNPLIVADPWRRLAGRLCVACHKVFLQFAFSSVQSVQQKENIQELQILLHIFLLIIYVVLNNCYALILLPCTCEMCNDNELI